MTEMVPAVSRGMALSEASPASAEASVLTRNTVQWVNKCLPTLLADS